MISNADKLYTHGIKIKLIYVVILALMCKMNDKSHQKLGKVGQRCTIHPNDHRWMNKENWPASTLLLDELSPKPSSSSGVSSATGPMPLGVSGVCVRIFTILSKWSYQISVTC